MNLLIVSYYQIYPFATGASIAQFGTIERLSHVCQVSLLIPPLFSPNPQELHELQALLPKVKIYTVRQSFEPGQKPLNPLSKSVRRVKTWVRGLKRFVQSRVGNKQLATPLKDEFDDSFSAYTVDFFHFKERELIEKLNEVIRQDAIDIVQLEFTENLGLVKAIPENIKKVFVDHESRYSRIAAHIKTRNINSSFAQYIYRLNKTIELSLMKEFDGVITFSDADALNLEADLWEQNTGVALKKPTIFTIPYPVLDQDFKQLKQEQFHNPTKLVFIGPEYHFPNKDAVEWFVEETAVEIFRRFGLKLYVIGEWTSQTIKHYENHESGVEFTGFVENLYEFYQDSIAVAPIRIGSGLKTKVMLAMAQGAPVIGTRLALSGIPAEHLESVMLADTQAEFCWAVDYLLQDRERTFSICQNAQQLMRQRYSQDLVSNLRYNAYQSLL